MFGMSRNWKEKLNEALTGMFSQPADFRSQKDDGVNGFQYTSDKLAVLLLSHKSDDGNYYWINLVIKPK